MKWVWKWIVCVLPWIFIGPDVCHRIVFLGAGSYIFWNCSSILKTFWRNKMSNITHNLWHNISKGLSGLSSELHVQARHFLFLLFLQIHSHVNRLTRLSEICVWYHRFGFHELTRYSEQKLSSLPVVSGTYDFRVVLILCLVSNLQFTMHTGGAASHKSDQGKMN